MLFYFSGFLGYLVMAHYMHTHLTWSRSKRLRTGIALMIIGAVWTIYSFYIQAIPGENLSTPVIEIGWAFCTINCVLLTTGTFLMFSCINQPKSPRLITERYHGDESKKDIQEKDTEYLARSRAAAEYCARTLGWHRIECTTADANGAKSMRSVEDINAEILAELAGIL